MRPFFHFMLLVALLGLSHPATSTVPTVESADFTNCLLRQNGTVVCWGDNSAGQATPANGVFVQISLGATSGCGLRENGQVVCWGDSNNSNGLLDVPPGTYTQVDAGDNNHCAVRAADQRIVCWGAIWGGEYFPFPDTDRFTQVSAGYRNFCGIRLDGTLACNGLFFPDPPSGSFVQVAADKGKSDSFCAIRTSGQVVCWGYELGNVNQTPAGTFSTAGRGSYHACGLRTDGTIACWGYFGNQDYRQYFPPPGQYSSLSVSATHNCALRQDGVTVCWGLDGAGAAPLLEIDPEVIPAAEVGVPYSVSLTMVDKLRDGSPGEYVPAEPLFALWSGQLPPGFGLGGDGHLQGTAVATGEFPVTLLAQDAHGYEVVRDISFTIVSPGQDVTPPLVSGSFTGTNAQLDWYRSNVTLNWTVSDPQSSVTSQLGCNTSVITQDTPRSGETFTCTARSTGGTTSKSVELRRDATPPSLQISSDALGDDTFDVHYAASDVTSDIAYLQCGLDEAEVASCPAGNPIRVGPLSPGPHAYYIAAVDNAGNITLKSTALGAPDTTPPVITPQVIGSAGTDDWYTGDVGLSWTVTDPESAITTSTGCGPESITSDTAGLTYTCEATSAGGTTQQSITIKRDSASPDTTILTGPTDPSPFGLPPLFTFTGSDSLSGVSTFQCTLDAAPAAACSSPYQLPAVASGSHTLSIVAVDRAGNVDPVPATHAWTVLPSGDSTPPIVTPSVTGTLGDNGWYRSNVNVSWLWSDPESAVTATIGCNPTTIAIDTAGTTFTCSVTSGGGTTTQQVVIKRDTVAPQTKVQLSKGLVTFSGSDALSGVARFECSVDGAAFATCTSPYVPPELPGGAHVAAVRAVDRAGNADATPDTYSWTAPAIDDTAPVASPVPSIAANQFGWNNRDITVYWNWVDTGSGLSSICTTRTTSVGEGVHVLGATCLDKQGNKGSASFTVRIDKTKPTLSPVVSLGQILLNTVIAAISNARDNISAIASDKCQPVNTAKPGTFTISCTATDLAGNSASAKTSYTVVYGLAAYNLPFVSPPSVNVIRLNDNVPMRFRLVDANGNPIATLKASQIGFFLDVISPSACTGMPQNVITETIPVKALTYLGNGNYEIGYRSTSSSCGRLSILPPVQTVPILVQSVSP